MVAQPLALFSGGALLVGAVARTDLISPDDTVPLARQLYRALHDRILALPDPLAVYPTHGAGSFCSAAGGSERTTTIGHERATNPFLTAPDEETFVRRLIAGLGTYPGLLPSAARGEPARTERCTERDLPAPPHADAGRGRRQQSATGAALVDVRPIETFAEGHIPGALSIALRPAFASWLGWLVAAEQPLVFVADADQDRVALVRDCLKIGYENLAGELAGGMAAWRAAGLPGTADRAGARGRDAIGPRCSTCDRRAEYVGGPRPGRAASRARQPRRRARHDGSRRMPPSCAATANGR